MPRMLEIAFPIILISVLRLHVTHVPLPFFHSQSLLIENIADIPVSYYLGSHVSACKNYFHSTVCTVCVQFLNFNNVGRLEI